VSLRRMVLRDFVIVSELELELAPRFTVLTGETGAGKSILIDALQLVTGGRADSSMIREGAARDRPRDRGASGHPRIHPERLRLAPKAPRALRHLR